MKGERRVVVTGVGLVTPIGNNVAESWSSVVEGRSGIGPITHFDASQYPCRVAGEVKGFHPEDHFDKKEIRKMDRFIQLGMVAAREAVADSGVTINEDNAERVGVVIGVGLGGLPLLEKQHAILLERGPSRISPFFIPMLIANMAAGMISMDFGAKGPNSCTTTACATGTHAVGDAFRILQRGDAEVIIAGSTEAVISGLCIGGFASMRALSTHNEPAQKASRPFDSSRNGFVVGEGAGVVVLEEREAARRRGAHIYAEVVGYGMSGDAHHMTQPDPNGSGPTRCMTLALKDAQIPREDVDYINAHGTATPQGDINETRAMKKVFGPHAHKLAVSSTKSMTGHLLGGAGGVENIFTILAIFHGVIPPTINLEEPDPECDLDYVPNTAREASIRFGLSNSFGFGGTNATLLFGKS